MEDKHISESSVLKQVTTYLDYLKEIKRLDYFRLNSGKIKVGSRWIKLAPKNSPDIIVLIPFKIKEHGMPMKHLVTIAIEVKRPYMSKWTEGQIKYAIDFELLGGHYYKIDNFDDVKILIEDWLRRGEESW